MMTRITIGFVVALALASPTLAQGTTDHDAHHPAEPASAAAAKTPAQVRKIDKDAGKITLRHEPIQNLDMPAMTMVFRVADPKFLDQVKLGDKILVTIDKIDGQLTVTQLEPAR
jgi:Cu(I)/Ag(I) efflux system periplasmic protein CusF